MKLYYRIVHSNMGYMPQITNKPEDDKSWAPLAARPKFDYNDALFLIGESKASFGEPEVVYEEEFDNGEAPAKVQDMHEESADEAGVA